jgi:hypothetical protein
MKYTKLEYEAVKFSLRCMRSKADSRRTREKRKKWCDRRGITKAQFMRALRMAVKKARMQVEEANGRSA